MNVLLFTLEYPPFKGGIANVYENIVKYWPHPFSKPGEGSNGASPVDAQRLYGGEGIFVLHNNDNKLINNNFFPKWLPAFWQLYKEVKKNKIDHILVGHILPLGTVTYYISKILKVRYSVFLHGMDFAYSQKTVRKKKMSLKILKNAEKIICFNSYVADLVREAFTNEDDHDKIEVINPGVEAQFIPGTDIRALKEKNKLDEKLVLFSVSRLVKRKGHDMVIKIMPRLLEKYPNLYFYIAGTGEDEDYLRELAKDDEHVVFLGKVSDNDKWLWLCACDMFVMPSRVIGKDDFEGFGIVYMEAAICSKPVVAGRSGGIEDAVIDHETGILVDPESEDNIYDGIDELAGNFLLRKEMGEKALERAAEEFNWGDKVKEIYERIVE
jgi:phosphatidyl-myo-inositol dimannoside synthase